MYIYICIYIYRERERERLAETNFCVTSMYYWMVLLIIMYLTSNAFSITHARVKVR